MDSIGDSINRALDAFGADTIDFSPVGDPVVLDDGRWTFQREGETPSEAMKRLEAGGPDVFTGAHPLNKPVPRFRSGGS